jgi:pimeloyl-ACP methyl ester carboxylesterase
MSIASSLHPFYFGPSDARLFGILHRGSKAASVGVVICQPTFEEVAPSLRGLRLASTRLAKAGLPVLRFDWFATGDSGGERGDETWERWVDDVGHAIDAIKTQTGVKRVILVGVRLGATLAAVAANDRDDVQAAVFWEPIENGRGYADWKHRDHLEWFDIEIRERPGAKMFATPNQRLGQSYAPALDRSLRQVELSTMKGRVADRAVLVRNLPEREEEAWFGTLGRLTDGVERVLVPEAADWMPLSDLEPAPVPVQTIRTIVEWVTQEAT